MIPHCEAPNHEVNRINLQRYFRSYIILTDICNLVHICEGGIKKKLNDILRSVLYKTNIMQATYLILNVLVAILKLKKKINFNTL